MYASQGGEWEFLTLNSYFLIREASVPQHRGDAAGFVELLFGIAVDDLDPAAHLEDRLAEAVDALLLALLTFTQSIE